MDKTLTWLMQGDPAIRWQTMRDLQNKPKAEYESERLRTENEGWGKAFLSKRNPDGQWGQRFYQPKWTSTHYTLLDLKHIGIPKKNKECKETINEILSYPEGVDGGIIHRSKRLSYDTYSDVCLDGMILNYASWFTPENNRLKTLVDYLLDKQMKDGGWNCEYHHGATHSSLHTTISTLEGLSEFQTKSSYRKKEIDAVKEEGIEFILHHKLFQSSTTGRTINKKMLMLSWPSRWRYDILRALDHFQEDRVKYDERMQDAIDILKEKQRKDGTWPLQHKHPGQVHFDMEEISKPSRWNTLRALRVLKHFDV